MIADLKPYPGMKESSVPWLGAVPEHWTMKRGKALFHCVDVRSSAGEEELLTVSSERGVVPRSSATVTMFKAESYAGYKLCWPGDLVINSLWAWGRGLGVSRHHGIISSAYGVYRLRPIFTEYSDYVHELVRSTPFNWELQVRSKGIWISRLQLTDEAFLGAPFPLPPPQEQAAIVRFLEYVDRRIRRYIRSKEKLIALLEEQKQAIIHQAVTGQIDVRTGHPYPAYKDSSVEWLEQVPEHWEVIPFKRRVGFQEGPGIMAADFRESGIPLLRISCLREELATLNGCNYLDPEMVALRWNHFAIRRGDYLLSASASTGEVSLATADVVGAIPYTGIIRLWGRSQKAIMEYVRLFMISGLFQDQIYRAKSGVGIEHFGPKHLNRMIITLPSVAEQEAIVGVCQEAIPPLAGAIAGARREVALLREYRTRLIADIVTGKLDVSDAATALPKVDPLAGGDMDGPSDTDVDSALENLESRTEVII